jgi:folate-binding protein YgfZ
MASQSPILPLMTEFNPQTLGYGPPGETVQVVECYDEIEFEYAALRRSGALFDQPHRGTLELRGADARGFLDRMLTQKLADLCAGQSRSAFWLNRQGRIRADLRIVAVEDLVLIDVDVHAANLTLESLREYLFSEDVEITDRSESWHRLSLHGPDGPRLLSRVSNVAIPEQSGQVVQATIAGAQVVVDRWDRTNEPGFELSMPVDKAAEVWSALLASAGSTAASSTPPESPGAGSEGFRVRPAGWHAFNIARIESGTPLFLLDFGPDSLPAESGVQDSRVSFAKGCYLGQEIVARLRNLGHPKQHVVALRFEKGAAIPADWQPVTGTPIFGPQEQDNAVGTVTSSTVSPMLGGELIMLAMVRWAHAQPESRVLLMGPHGGIGATVQPQLQFWPRTTRSV